MDTVPERYRPSGRLRPFEFFAGTAAVLVTSALGALALHLAFVGGFYLVAVAPFLAALPAVGLLVGTVAWSHCRNRVAAGLVGLVATVAISLGHYHADLLGLIGWQNYSRVDLLPRYIWLRLQTDQLVHPGDRAAPARRPGPADAVFNGLAAALETGMVAGILLLPACRRASRAYCEEHGCWMQVQTIPLDPGTGELIADALRAADATHLGTLLTPAAAVGRGSVALERCLAGDDEGERIYVSVHDRVESEGSRARLKVRTLARRWRIEGALAAAVVRAFQKAVPAAAAPPPQPDASLPGASAEIVPVPAPFGGRVLTGAHLTVGVVISLLPLLVGLGGGGGLVVYVAAHNDALSALEIGALVGLGIAFFAGCLGYMALFSDFLPSRYLYRLSREEIARRPDPWVSLADEQALYVQVIPRAHWNRMMIENASDVGLLLVDVERRQVLFEGDRERWRIPGDAIRSCVVESFIVGGEGNPGGSNKAFFVAVLKVQRPDGIVERPVTRRHIYWGKRGTCERELEARAVARLIGAVGPASTRAG
jgi:hypothetical protein